MKRLNIAMTGYGGVGRALAVLLGERRAYYRARYAVDVRLTGICRSATALVDPQGLLAAPPVEAFAAPAPSSAAFLALAQADVLIEAGPSDFRTGGPGLRHMRAAIDRGADVVAVSKGALVHDGAALRARASASGVALKASGAAAAALPTIDLVRHCLAGCRIHAVEGILNATSNLLLSAMMERGIGLEEALAEAQRAGIAEADPRLDIEGWDTACKILIIALLGLDADLSIDDMAVTGIQHVRRPDIDAWRKAGLVPRLVGWIRPDGDMPRAGVELRLFPPDDPFARVGGRNKAIRIETDAMGTLFAGGGGSEPRATAAAALKDLEHILAGAR